MIGAEAAHRGSRRAHASAKRSIACDASTTHCTSSSGRSHKISPCIHLAPCSAAGMHTWCSRRPIRSIAAPRGRWRRPWCRHLVHSHHVPTLQEMHSAAAARGRTHNLSRRRRKVTGSGTTAGSRRAWRRPHTRPGHGHSGAQLAAPSIAIDRRNALFISLFICDLFVSNDALFGAARRQAPTHRVFAPCLLSRQICPWMVPLSPPLTGDTLARPPFLRAEPRNDALHVRFVLSILCVCALALLP